MRKFKLFEYIYNEASQPGELSDASSLRLHDIIQQRIKRKFNLKVYIQPMRIPIERSGNTLYGTMFMLDDGKHAFRLNYNNASGGNVNSVDFWLHPSAYPQLHVPTSELNVVQVVSVIEEVLDKKRAGSILVDEAGNIEEQDEVIMNEARGEKSTGEKTRRKRKNKDDDDEDREPRKRRTKRVKVEKIDIPEQVKIRDEYSALFDDPLDEQELFSLLEFEIDKIRNRKNRALLITGDPGIGKSYTVTKKLAGDNSITFKGSITGPAALY